MSITTPCLRALTALVEDGFTAADRLERHGLPATAQRAAQAACTLDGARTRLVEDGPDYLDAAWAFLDAGRKVIAEYQTIADRAETESRARARA